jgi:hypothetical protein
MGAFVLTARILELLQLDAYLVVLCECEKEMLLLEEGYSFLDASDSDVDSLLFPVLRVLCSKPVHYMIEGWNPSLIASFVVILARTQCRVVTESHAVRD